MAADRPATNPVSATTDAWLRRLTRGNTRVVILGHRDDHMRWVSDNIEDLLSLTVEDMRSNVIDRLHPDDLAAYLEAQANMTNRGLTLERVLFRVLGNDGRWRQAEATMTNFVGDPEIDGVIVEIADIVEMHDVDRIPRSSVRNTEAMLRNQAALRAMVDHVADTLVLIDERLDILWASPGVTRMIGYEPHEVVHLSGLDLLHPDDIAYASEEFAALLAEPQAERTVTVRLRHKEPTPTAELAYTWVEILGRNELRHPELGSVVLSLRDVSERKAAEADSNRLTEVLEATEDMVVIFDRSFRVLWTNPAGQRVLRSLDKELGVTMSELLPQWVTKLVVDEVLPHIKREGQWRGELAILDGAGSALPVDVTYIAHHGADGRVEFMSAIARDISERKHYEDRLAEQARSDALTGLANRLELMSSIEALIGPDGPGAAVAFIDIDRFKLINDSQGHDIGDQVIVAMASRLRAATRDTDIVARFGGDEFVVVWPGVTDLDHAHRLAERLLDDVTGPVDAGGSDAYLTASAGVAVGAPGSAATMVLSEADAAMYRAKDLGRDRVAAYDSELRAHVKRRMTVAAELRLALADDQIVAHYQPVLCATSRVPVSYEALARWQHPEQGLLFPGHFIDVAEETGIIGELGHAVMRHACRTMAAAPTSIIGDDITFSVNLSPKQLGDPGLADRLAAEIDAAGLEPHRFTMEVTESLLMADVATSTAHLHKLRSLGVRIAIDDFGTGYSSLAYLEQFPIDILKIDRQFVAPLGDRRLGDYSLIAGIIGLSRSLGHLVVAEGVETESQAEILTELGCDLLQGFLFSKAVEPSVLLDAARAEDPATS